MASSSENSKILDAVMRTVADRLLKAAGFIRSGRKFYNESSGLILLINFQKGKVTTGEEIDFSIYVEVSLPLWHSMATDKLPPKNPASISPIYAVNLNVLCGSATGLVWKVSPSVSVEAVGEEIAALLQAHALPFLESTATLSALAEVIEGSSLHEPYRFLKVAAIKEAQGAFSSAAEYIAREQAAVPPGCESIAEMVRLMAMRLAKHRPNNSFKADSQPLRGRERP